MKFNFFQRLSFRDGGRFMFWKNKKKEIDNGFILLKSNIKMSIQKGSEKDKQIKMINFSIEELHI